MGGNSGQSAGYSKQGVNEGLINLKTNQALQSNPELNRILAQYGSGSIGFRDALNAANSASYDTSQFDSQLADLNQQALAIGNSDEDESVRRAKLGSIYDQMDSLKAQKQNLSGGALADAIHDSLATSSITGNKFASDQVMSDDLYKGLFGSDSLSSKAQSEYGSYGQDVDKLRGILDQDREALLGRDSSYGLTPEDLAAYGQASDQISRMFGSQQQSLSQALADRGLASAPSGIATQGFSNLMGNQQEQLKNAQLQIAQNRINSAMQLAQTRAQSDQARMNAAVSGQDQAGNLALGLGSLAKGAQSQYYSQNLAGVAQRHGDSKAAAEIALANQGEQQDIMNELFAQQQATKNPGFLGGLALGTTAAGATIGSGGMSNLGSGAMLANSYGTKKGNGNTKSSGSGSTDSMGGAASMASMFA